MTTRNYSSRSQQTTLTSAVTAGASTMVVQSGSALLGGQSIPAGTTFTIVLDPDTAIEEIVDATAVSTNTFTITRGIDGSSGQAHSAGAVARHMAIGRDYREANTHIEDSTGVHGISNSSDVVGTLDSQILTNKTLTAPTINAATLTGAVTASATVTLTGSIVASGGTITGLSSVGMSASSATPKDYVDSILGSATSAAISAASAAVSATAAATSATSAAASATAAASSASASATSASAAATSASSAAVSATAAATSATSAAASATAAATSATSAAASQTAAATSATSASASATAAATSATSAAASATASASSATAASSSAVVAASYASAAPEFRQYGAEGSVLNNIPTRVHDAESLLKQAVWWIDSAHSGSSGQAIKNLGWGGSALDATAGSTTAADSNDPRYLDWSGINYVYTPGVGANYLSVPDANNLDIVGDIDVRVQVAMDDWTPAATTYLLSKYLGATMSYAFRLSTDGTLRIEWSADGSTILASSSTVVTGLTDGTVKWVRATLTVNNGASGNDAKFYLSDNGITWTQLGTTVTTVGVTSIFNSTNEVQIGARNSGSGVVAGNLYRAQILNGIDGVPVLDVDTSVIATGAATSFTALTGQTVTINRATSGRKTTVVTHPVWLFGTDDYMEVNNRWLEHAAPSANYVYLNGTAGNYMSSPDSAALDVVGDIDLRVQVALDDWTPSAEQSLIGKRVVSGSQQSYWLSIYTDGKLVFSWSTNGSTAITTQTSSVATGITDGSTKWVRATMDVDNGASGYEIKYYLSDDGINWTQLGTTVTGVGTTSIFSGTAALEVGSVASGGNPSKGKFFRAQVYNGIAGTLVFDADASIITDGTASTFKERSSNAATVTINKSGTGTFASTNSYMYLPGVNGNYASSPDSAALDITGDIDVRVKVAMDDWTPGSASLLVSKWTNAGARSFYFYLTSTGGLSGEWSVDGTAGLSFASTNAVNLTDGSVKWVRWTMDVDNGASGRDHKFYTSNDGLTWTQLGSTVTQAGTTSIFAGTAALEVGSYLLGGTTSRGKFFRAQVLNGINGTLAFDANFESSITTNLPTTFTESSANAATVTINYSGTGYRSAGVIASTYVFPGNPNTFKLSSYSMLDFGATDSFTALVIIRQWATPATFGVYLGIQDMNAGKNSGWSLQHNTSTIYALSAGDGTNSIIKTSAALVSGNRTQIGAIIDRSAQTAVVINDATLSTTVSTSSLGSLIAPTNILRIGRNNTFQGSPNYYQDMEFVSAAIFRRALTAGEIATLNSYFQGRVS